MKKAALFLAEGFEETEAIVTADVLRRADVDTALVSIGGRLEVKSAHGVVLKADLLLSELKGDYDVLVLPGGMPGAAHLDACAPLKDLLAAQASAGRWVAAICAAPLVLGGMGLLKGRKATCYPGFEERLLGAKLRAEPAVVDGNFVTGRGPGAAFDFALCLVACLSGEEKAREVADGLLYTGYKQA
jgi:4-methyl-5(b-hydroxyethyl)-thiazole monophosphate biosynthesis